MRSAGDAMGNEGKARSSSALVMGILLSMMALLLWRCGSTDNNGNPNNTIPNLDAGFTFDAGNDGGFVVRIDGGEDADGGDDDRDGGDDADGGDDVSDGGDDDNSGPGSNN